MPRKDFDFVLMDDYRGDTRELANRAAEIATALKRGLNDSELERLRAIWLLVAAAGGRVVLSHDLLARFDHRRAAFTSEVDEANCQVIITATVREPT